MKDVLESILRDSLSLDENFVLAPDTKLLGAIPELDSMAVVTILINLEEKLGLELEDDELNAEIFETYGDFTDFVESNRKV